MTIRAAAVVLVLLGGVAATAREDPPTRPPREPDLRRELLRRVRDDQAARTALIEWQKHQGAADPSTLDADRKAAQEKLVAAVRASDRANTARLRQIIEAHGWPSRGLVGEDGAHAAWLLVQHADADVKFQRTCLDLMAKLPEGEVSRTDLAYLTDRVLLAEGKKQVYGTQFILADGKWEPRPLEDPADVDRRRATVGLPPMAEYAKQLESFYGRPSKP